MSPDRVDDRTPEQPLDPSRVVPYRRWSDPAIDNDMRIFPALPDGHDASSNLWASGLQTPVGGERATEETSTGGWLSGLVKDGDGPSSAAGGSDVLSGLLEGGPYDAPREADGSGPVGGIGGADDSGRQRRTWQSGLDFSEESLVGEETPASTWLAGLVKVERRPAINDIARLLFGGEPSEAPEATPPTALSPPPASFPSRVPPGPAATSPTAPFASASGLVPPTPRVAPTVPSAAASSIAPPAAAPTLPPSAAPTGFPPPSPAASGLGASSDHVSAFPVAPDVAPLPGLRWPSKPSESAPTGSAPIGSAPIGSAPIGSAPIGFAPTVGVSPTMKMPRPSERPPVDEERVVLPRGLESAPPLSPAPAVEAPRVARVARPAAAPLELDLLSVPKAAPASAPALAGASAPPAQAPDQPTVSRMVTGKVSGRDRVSFYRSLAAMFEAGVPVFAIFEFLSREGESKALCEACRRMGQNLVTGMALNAAAMQEPDLFDIKAVRMLEVGYKGGQLEQILRQLAEDEEHAWGLRQSLKSQLTYPCGIAMMTMLAVLLMPPLVLTDLLEQVVALTSRPPMLTRWLLNLSAFLSSPWTLGAAAVLAFVMVGWFRSPKGRKMVDNAELTYWFIPGLGPLWRNLVGLRFLRVFSMVYQAGLPATAGLELAASATGSQMAYRVAPLMKRTLIDGGSLTDAFASGGFLPGLALEAVRAGESSGNVPVMLDNSAMILEAEVQSRVDAVAKLIEPLVLVVMGVIVGVFVLGCLLPIVELTATL